MYLTDPSPLFNGEVLIFNMTAPHKGVVKLGNYSHAQGLSTLALNEHEHSEGKYNISYKGIIHSVGIGTSETNRKNAHEIMQNGKHYILGIGGYDGTNPTNSEDLAKVINNKAEKTDIVKSDWNQNDPTAKDYIKNKPFYSIINTPFTELNAEESDVARIEISIDIEDEFCIRTPYWVIGPFNDMDEESYGGLYTPYGNITSIYRDDTLFYLNTDVADTTPIITWLNENAYVGYNINGEDLVNHIPDIYISNNIARKSDIVQADYIENNISNKSYIINKPCSIDYITISDNPVISDMSVSGFENSETYEVSQQYNKYMNIIGLCVANK